jgi:hypothetical protein
MVAQRVQEMTHLHHRRTSYKTTRTLTLAATCRTPEHRCPYVDVLAGCHVGRHHELALEHRRASTNVCPWNAAQHSSTFEPA